LIEQEKTGQDRGERARSRNGRNVITVSRQENGEKKTPRLLGWLLFSRSFLGVFVVKTLFQRNSKNFEQKEDQESEDLKKESSFFLQNLRVFRAFV
jgi:hypothetical protein